MDNTNVGRTKENAAIIKANMSLLDSFTNTLLLFYIFKRGSRISRKPSPKRLRPKTESAIALPGNTTIQGATVIKLRPSLTIPPQLGSGGLMPTPKKLNAA